MIREAALPNLVVWPDSPPAPAREGEGEGGLVSECDRYVRSPVDTQSLERSLEQLSRAHRGASQSPVKLDTRNGHVDLVAEVRAKPLPEQQKVLPLRLGALRRSLGEIERGDGWLADRNPVFYIDGKGQAHIDFTNLAGFIVDPMGHILSRSVNPD